MSKVLIKLPRKVLVEELGREVMLGSFEKHLIKDPSKDFSSSKGQISATELSAKPHRFKLNKEEYITLEADFLDKYKSLRRLAQIITLKDIGRIITLLGLTDTSIVVEAGSGSGAFSKYIAPLVKHIHSYEINDDHLAVAKENCQDYSNITFYKQDIYESVGEHQADAFLLDVPDPSKALSSVAKALRIGGRAVIYAPNLTQTQSAVLHLPENLLYEQTIQLTEVDWEVKERILRPRMQGLGHTAFLTLVRKLP